MEDNMRKKKVSVYIYIYIYTYIYIHTWVTLLYNRNWQNLVNQLYYTKNFYKTKQTRRFSYQPYKVGFIILNWPLLFHSSAPTLVQATIPSRLDSCGAFITGLCFHPAPAIVYSQHSSQMIFLKHKSHHVLRSKPCNSSQHIQGPYLDLPPDFPSVLTSICSSLGQLHSTPTGPFAVPWASWATSAFLTFVGSLWLHLLCQTSSFLIPFPLLSLCSNNSLGKLTLTIF